MHDNAIRISLALTLVCAACATAPAVKPEDVKPAIPAWSEEPDSPTKVRLTIVGTNDLHGWIEPHDREVPDRPLPILGGTDIFAGYLNIIRQKRAGGVVLLDGGDLFQGTLVVNMTEGEAIIKAYNLLDYDAAAVGNHEFDYGPVGDPVIAMSPTEDPNGNLRKRIKQARFPFLSANTYVKATGQPVDWSNLKRSTIVERKGVRIGIIGLTTPLTPTVTLAVNVKHLEFRALKETTEYMAKDLRNKGADVVVIVLHAGTGCNQGSDAADSSSCDPHGELYELLEQLPKGLVDAAVGGHTHQYLANFINGTPAIQSSSFGVAFGMIDLWYDKAAKALDTSKTKIWSTIPLCRRQFSDTRDCRKEGQGVLEPVYFMGEEVKADEKVAEALRPDIKAVESRKKQELGPVLEKPFTRSRTRESELGDFVADVLRNTVPGAAVAFTNSGGLRADLPLGALTYGDVFNALPFENRIAVLSVTGDELVELARQGVSGKHGIIQVSGLRVHAVEPGVEPCAKGTNRLLEVTLDDGAPIDPGVTYQVVTNDFIAGGGDGYADLMTKLGEKRVNVRNDLPPLREIVVTYMRMNPELTKPPKPESPRIEFVTPDCTAAAKP